MIAPTCPASGQRPMTARSRVKKLLTLRPMTIAKITAEGFLNAKAAPEIESRRLAGRKRRALVLTDETARHPFRASLPQHVTAVAAAPQGHESPAQTFWQLTRDDVRGFASVYFATFAAVLVFIF